MDKANVEARSWPDPYSIPLEDFNVARPRLFRDDAMWPFFARLRKEAPVHYCRESRIGPYWSVSTFDLIMAVDTSHKAFSSDAFRGGVNLVDFDEDFTSPSFITMDPPKHDTQRKVVQPIVAPANLAKLEDTIRARTAMVLDGLPRGATFNWVDRVSIELTTMMLATLFDFPFEERWKLTRWSDISTAQRGAKLAGGGVLENYEQRREELAECLDYFTRLWNERVNSEPRPDLISMLAHGEATRDMDPMEYLGTLTLLIVGGNDTTRNSMTGGVLALNQFPEQYEKLRANPALIDSMVPEIIRWQTPLAYMRRTAVEDVELGGQTIRAGDKVAMWYVSGNRDEAVFDRPDELIIDRPQPRRHLSFGFGIHRCVGNRLAELQLRILWEEILARLPPIEVVGPPVRVLSSFVKGYESLPVRIPN
ncbi:MAG: cytochrome P450 [Hyphomonadaceae bacterium]|nr:cytochrome P450 [Hyphomonadaceae bacterium]